MSYTIDVKIESYDVQPSGNVKISSLLKAFQKAAGDELLDTPLCYFNLAKHNIAFVLTKMTVQIISDIKIYDRITVVTHARKTRGVSFPRDFIVKRDNEVVAVARSVWALIDLEKRCVLRPSAIDSIGNLAFSELDSFEINDVRRIIDGNSLLRTNVREVCYSHLDMNNHLNNTYYSDFIFDCIDSSPFNSDKGLFLQINYKAEARLGDVLNINVFGGENNGEYDFSADIKGSDKVCFTAYLKRCN